ncbi:tetraspanin8 [Hibiscus trionum]|uniref:Tetraspanin8 n=1 Tax=Hibiscus trionum TaxID=183268 RepID=A0A9W7LNI4_HIBTR|nr:tetraspanin8 [Hibiscus trionum]
MSFHWSNNVLGVINILMFLFSIPIIVVGVLITKSGITACGLSSDKSLVGIGVSIMIFSLVGFFASCCRGRWVRWVLCSYLVVVIILILTGFGFTVFTFAVSNKGSGQTIPGKEYKEYKLEKYSSFIQLLINEPRSWKSIRTCIVDSKICNAYETRYRHDTVQMLYQERLNSLQSGCCKPPDECGFTYRGPTNWTEENGVYYNHNPDCKAWENIPQVLCFNCQSCKAGAADNIKRSLKKEATVNVVFLLLLIIVYCIGVCACRNRAKDNAYSA